MSKDPKSSKMIAGLQEANYQKALDQVAKISNRQYKGDQVQLMPELSHFKMYGAGVYLFFSFLKHATILFIILTVVSIVPIALNGARGNTFRNSENSLSVFLTRTSVGSHKYSILNTPNAYQESIAYKIVNVTFDIISCAIFLIFCLYWQRKSKTIQQHISKQIKLQSSLTVEVVEFSQNIKQPQMEQFMGKFGNVTEIVAARDYTQQLKLSKKIYELQLQKRQMELQGADENYVKFNEITEKIKQLSSNLQKATDRKHVITRFYVQYENDETRKEVLRKFQPYQKLCSCCKQKPEELCLNGCDVKVVACNTEPTGVLWENAHFTWKMRIPRQLLQLVVVLGVLFAGFFFISFLNILVPPIDSDVDTSNFSYQQVKASNNTSLIQAWCIQNFVLDGKNSPYISTCDASWKMYVSGIIISIAISVIIMILCEIIKKVVYALAEFQCYTTRSQKSVTILTNMFIMQLLTTTLITFLMQANIFGLSILTFWSNHVTSNDLKNNIVSMNQYSDLIPRWYKDIGYQIWFNIFIMIFFPQIGEPLFYFVLSMLKDWRAKKEKIHKKMLAWLQPPQFQIESHYTNLLVIIGTGFIFGGGIQLMMAIVMLCLFIRYFYLRYFFVRFCRVPNQFNGVLNQRMITILKAILIVRCLISIYMYGADDVFAMEKSTFMMWASSMGVPVFSSIFTILSRFALTWYYTIFVIIFILILIFKDFLVKAVRRFKKWRKQGVTQTINPVVNKTQNEITNPANNGSKSRQDIAQIDESSLHSWVSNQNQQINSQRQVLKSYKLSNNPMYEQFLAIMNIKALVSYAMKKEEEGGAGVDQIQIPNESQQMKNTRDKYLKGNK